MITVDGIGDGHREKFRAFENGPEKQTPVMFPVVVVYANNKH